MEKLVDLQTAEQVLLTLLKNSGIENPKYWTSNDEDVEDSTVGAVLVTVHELCIENTFRIVITKENHWDSYNEIPTA